uniref:ATP synthase subunit a n=1 Tax=Cosmoscarta bispecularis TaxID=798355 RepID=A0A0U1YQ12_9HEMI|nr:ATP synthase F0 subunit 6 [Cosmoscarta bispecularis]AZL35832.1 ATP synthase F0 subunit 6 [Cosmoscarta bispecularis]QHR79672.1 ATP synthase F0 subunit 6 [Cosmoscarta dorsimacula]
MMTNLFSVFDPSTGLLTLNWMSTFIILMMIPMMYWIMPSRFLVINLIIIEKLYNELKMLMGNKYTGNSILFITMFFFILTNNMMGLLPYIFTSSSHLVFTLSLALPMWLTLMIFGWLNKTNKMFYHMIPLGTPPMLMPFMVCIETMSNIIRPGSLAVRLTANMIAGHLLMTLLGNLTLNLNSVMMMSMILIQIILMLFETAVSIIQAYVFTVLSTLYSSEI